MSPVNCRSQVASSSLICEPTKNFSHLQPSLLTKHREATPCHKLHRCRAATFTAQTTRLPNDRMHYSRCSVLAAARCSCCSLVRGEGTHGTGAGCLQQHLWGAFYTSLFLHKVIKKKKLLLVVHTEIWNYRLWVGILNPNTCFFPLPSHLSQPPWSKETKKWYTRPVVMWTKK